MFKTHAVVRLAFAKGRVRLLALSGRRLSECLWQQSPDGDRGHDGNRRGCGFHEPFQTIGGHPEGEQGEPVPRAQSRMKAADGMNAGRKTRVRRYRATTENTTEIVT